MDNKKIAHEINKYNVKRGKMDAKKIVDENLSVRDIEELSKNTDVKRKNPINRINNSSNNQYGYVEKELSEYLGTKVKVGSKKIEIKYDNSHDLDRILEIMGININ